MPKKSMTFEQSMERLEEIVRRLESGEAALSESLKLFEEGTKLVRTCGDSLDDAELKVVRLMKGADGAPVETEFTDDSVS